MCHFIMPRFFVNIERWKWNKELRLYVSTHGHFKDEHKRNIACKVRSNYFWVSANNKWILAHRAVLLTWRPLPVDGEPMTVDHLNNNTRDNRLCNLEWVTEEENLRRAKENILRESKLENIAKTKLPELPFKRPLLSTNLHFTCHDSVPYTILLNKVSNEDILIRKEGVLYSINELYEKFNVSGAGYDKFLHKVCNRAFNRKEYNGMLFELIRVK